MRADEPLSAYAPKHDNPIVDPTTVTAHLIPAFIFAARQVPEHFHTTTSVQYQATAGMRLLDEWQQTAVYDALYEGLRKHPDFVFSSLQRADLQTLSGELEGYYGAVAANYLHGKVNANLTLKEHDDHPMGALDMGGSSTQLVFLPKQNKQQSSTKTNTGEKKNTASSSQSVKFCGAAESYGEFETQTCQVNLNDTNYGQPHTLNLLDEERSFFSTSYLSYGVDQFRERLWTTWVNEHKQQYANLCSEDTEVYCNSKMIENPCANPGYKINWHGHRLIGTGDAFECMREVQRLIPHPTVPVDDKTTSDNTVAGILNPSVEGHKFVAMSLFFFSLDSLRELSGTTALNKSWPNPSIQELVDALPILCRRSWDNDLVKIQHNSHKFTRAEVLPHRCLESVYMVTLLRDGFGFQPESRSITFLYETEEGDEVEWTLGMALSVKALVNNKDASKLNKIKTDMRIADDLEELTTDCSKGSNCQSNNNHIHNIKSRRKHENDVKNFDESDDSKIDSYRFLMERLKSVST
jgi:Golgi nucleoside diphosphatase